MNKKISTVFFGTHNFASTILKALISNPLFDIQLVVTQPDKPVGRDQILQKSPVKLIAEENSINLTQPTKLSDLRSSIFDLDVGITAQYGLIIPQSILDIPKHGIINIHTSLLPKYRGASPIQSALINGDTETGVTIMKMEAGLDTGPILLQKKLLIQPDDTYLDLDKKLADLAIEALFEAIPKYISGELLPIPQNESEKIICKQLSRDDGKIDWNKSADEIYNLYRGLTPWPGVWTMWKNKRIKLLKIKPSDKVLELGNFVVDNDNLFVGCNEGSVEILELQLEGKKIMETKEFLNGYKSLLQ